MSTLSSFIPAVVLDWAGTMVDHGCCAPVAALQAVLGRHGLEVSEAEARVGMGRPKRDHLRALLATRGAEAATEEWYPELERAIYAELEGHAALIAGAREFAAWLGGAGVKIGSSTGYTRDMMQIVATAAARQGYVPDAIVTPDEVPAGRPAPHMIYASALRLNAWPLWALVKIGDTPDDIAEGRNAGTWTVGLALSGNALGLSAEESAALDGRERATREAAARTSLRATGADYVVDSVADCPAVLEEIAGRLAAGERPRL
jgi:phosphonoacetaldehyde hydrolase